MKIGLIGAPASGKTTVFNALTGHQAPVGGGGKINLAVVRVPDPRIEKLSAICNPKKTIFAELKFADLPGKTDLRELQPELADLMREFDALALVLRAFEGGDPHKEMVEMETEIVLADLGLIEKRLARLAKEKGRPGEGPALERLKAHLEGDQPLRTASVTADEKKLLSGFSFLSLKPVLWVVNVDEAHAGGPVPDPIAREASGRGAAAVVLSGSVESEIARLAPGEQGAFLQDLGLEEPAIGRFIRAAYGLCDLVSFFTVGPDEVRAWTIRRGDNARTAAGKIHSDLERGFIRAEVVTYEDFVALGSEARCKEVGKLRTEGKDYVVKDGDILHVRFNV